MARRKKRRVAAASAVLLISEGSHTESTVTFRATAYDSGRRAAILIAMPHRKKKQLGCLGPCGHTKYTTQLPNYHFEV